MVASPASHSSEEARISLRGWSKDGGQAQNDVAPSASDASRSFNAILDGETERDNLYVRYVSARVLS